MADYTKNKWVGYNHLRPRHQNPDSYITAEKLNHMEDGIYNNSKGVDIICNDINDEDTHVELMSSESGDTIKIYYNNKVNDNKTGSTTTWSSSKIDSDIFASLNEVLNKYKSAGIDLTNDGLNSFLDNIWAIINGGN